MLCILPQYSATASDRPNILFIVSDDHGWGDLPSNWDKTEVKLPALDALAAGGVRFPHYHTEPLCGPSCACSKADWKMHVAELERTDLQVFDLSQDIAEQNDLRTKLPEVYASLKTALIDYFANLERSHYGTLRSGRACVDLGTTQKQSRLSLRESSATFAEGSAALWEFHANGD